MPTRWVRVRDTTTGAQFDVEARSLRYGLEPLNDPRYPDLVGPLARPRPAKAFVGKDGKPAVPGAVVVHVDADGEETTVAEPSQQGPSPEVVEVPPAGVVTAADDTEADPGPDASPKGRRAAKTTAPAAQPSTEKGSST